MGNWGGLASSSGDNACDGPGKLNWDMCGTSGNDRTSWTHTFDTVGTFNYHDWVYQNSAQRPEGVVNVVASGASTPVAVSVLVAAAPAAAEAQAAAQVDVTVPTSWTNSTSAIDLNEYHEFEVPEGLGMMQSWSFLVDEQFVDTSVCEVIQPNGSSIMASNFFAPGYGEQWGLTNYPYWYHGFLIGVSTVTCTATDDVGNVGTGTFTVTIFGTGPEIIITAEKTTLDRNIQNDFAEVTVSYQNLSPSADVIIQTPDPDQKGGGYLGFRSKQDFGELRSPLENHLRKQKGGGVSRLQRLRYPPS